jgi:RimJ/RimL family protein N-acetyltransferase
MDVDRVTWDSSALGVTAAHIGRFELSTPHQDAARWREYEQWRDQCGVGFVCATLNEDQLAECAWLEGKGFRFIETTLTPHINLAGSIWSKSEVDVRPAWESDTPHLASIAETVFIDDRFSKDPKIPRAVSGIRYKRWVESTQNHPSQRLLKASYNGSVVGFFIVEELPGHCYWHLTAIDQRFQGQGLGKMAMTTLLSQCAEAGFKRVRTRISSRNTPSLNLHASLGFRFEPLGITLHWVRE